MSAPTLVQKAMGSVGGGVGGGVGGSVVGGGVGAGVVWVYTRVRPASFLVAPTASRVPSADSDTDEPDRSLAASPSMSAPSLVHAPLFCSNTRVWPASAPAPSFLNAPTATRVPSAEIATDTPK